MKWLLPVSIFLVVLLGAFLLLNNYIYQEKQADDPLIGGERTEEGCLAAAGYSFSESVGACVREWELTPDIAEAARLAVEHVGAGYALTVVSFNSYEEEGSYDIFLEQGEERTPKTVYIRNGEVAPAPDHEAAEMVGFQFMQDVVAIAPPSTDTEAAARLYNSLSSVARAQVEEETLARDIAQFVDIQDVPDRGVSVEDLQVVSQSEMYLVVGLNYSGARVLRNIYLVVEDTEWKVDRVSVPNEGARVELVGNLVRNNPGLEPDTWYIVTEAPGQPAITTSLEFSETSTCAIEDENMTCVPEELEVGARVSVIGESTTEGVVQVTRLSIVGG